MAVLVCIESILKVPVQNGVYLLYIMLEIHHSGREPSICSSFLKPKHCAQRCMFII